MQGRDRALALLVPVLWGLNFPATALMLDHYPPLLGVALRFLLLAVPTVLLVPRPAIRLRWLILTGLGLGVLQFGFLYGAIVAGMPAGLASLVLQSSAPFTIILAMLLLGERQSRRQAAGIALSVLGLALIGLVRARSAAWWPVALTLMAGLGWAVGNIGARLARPPKPLHLTLWMSVIPLAPMFLLSFLFERDRILPALGTALTRAALPADLGLLYIVIFASLIGYGIWTTLMSRYPASQVAPWSMLVPVVGVLSSWLVLGERPHPAELAAGLLVIAGVLMASRPPRSGTA
ncbi:EamA family transporter [Paracoccus contaminans]|uniref:EamA family transporter n=1 Tax=Paracoccus contaminans TaxID=1945662 RepID=A0A1W6CXE5_9RHOB|nr:EamA family transporter [Paracoccus contaminans]ARJ69538.1 EamA family transporter [Paracoccus contaminans]